MVRLFKTLLCSCWFLLCSFSVLYAEDVPQFEIDLDKSSLTFKAVQNGAEIEGQFKKFTGKIQFHPDHLDQSSVEIEVDMNSVDASYKDVVQNIKTKDWFFTTKYPTATMKTQNIEKVDGGYKANAELTIRDQTMPVEIMFNVAEFSAEKAHAKGKAALKRKDFNVGWEDTKAVENDVQVIFDVMTMAAQ